MMGQDMPHFLACCKQVDCQPDRSESGCDVCLKVVNCVSSEYAYLKLLA